MPRLAIPYTSKEKRIFILESQDSYYFVENWNKKHKEGWEPKGEIIIHKLSIKDQDFYKEKLVYIQIFEKIFNAGEN